MSKRPSTADRDPSVTESADGDRFLSRWSRRKAVARTGGDPDAVVGESAVDGKQRAEAAAQAAEPSPAGDDSQVPELTDEDMPPLESIDENTDMRGFFSPKVTQAVKKAALRKFFHNPAFNVVDGLDDYDDDFRSFAALGDIVTSDMRSQIDREAERARKTVANDDQAPESSVTEESPTEEARTEEVDEAQAADEHADIADDDGAPEQIAAAQPGVTREPGTQVRIGHGKLRPRGAADEDA